MSAPDPAYLQGQLDALRAIRNAAITLNRKPDHDPYTWGIGGDAVVKLIERHFYAARDAVQQQQQHERNGS